MEYYSIGGATFLGLCCLLTGCSSYEEAIKAIEIGIEIDEGIEQIEVLIIDIPNFEQVKRHFEDKSIWFNLRLFTFDTTSNLPLK